MKSSFANIARIALGTLGLSSVLIEVIVLTNEHVFNAANFFSFFTIISNTLAGCYLIYFGITNNDSAPSQAFRGAITLYMLMTGIIFAALLAGLDNVRLTAVPWDNIVLHYIMPIILVVDWLIAPPKDVITKKVTLLWIVFPLLYVLYSLVRGSITGWYPYPFLNPSLSSYTQALFTSAIIALFVIGAAFSLRLLTLKRRRS